MNARILQAELRDEFLSILRNPVSLFFSVLMPVGFFAMTIGLFGGEGYTLPAFAAYGAFAVILVVSLNPGIGLAESRDSGWLRVARASGTPLELTLIAKVVAAIPYAVAVLLAMFGTALAFGALTEDLVGALAVGAILVVGSLPFALFGLAIGAKVGPNGTTAILNGILFPMVVASGLWFPLEILPEFVQTIARFLPPYHLAGLAAAPVGGGDWLLHAMALVTAGVIGAIAATLAYRSAKP